MRKLIVSNMMSLNGYYAGPNGDVMVLSMDDAFNLYNAERLRTASTLLVGRESFEMFRDHWPSVADDPNADDTNRDISRLNNAIDKVVISDTLTPDEVAPWHNTRIISRADAHAEIATLKQQPGADILLFGSHVLWNDLLSAGLVDELHVMVGHTIVGEGSPSFQPQPTVRLRLLDTRTWDGSNNVLIRYAVDVEGDPASIAAP